jgi:type IV pilus assembly protein PilA
MASRLFRRRGFTLIELLLVIGIIAILASIVIVAINPTKQLGDARNAQRRSDVNTILNAVYQYAIDNNGNLPTGIPTGSASAKIICQSWVAPATCTGVDIQGINLRMLSGTYITGVPRDPQLADTGTGSRYMMYQDTAGRITVYAPYAERGASITVTR